MLGKDVLSDELPYFTGSIGLLGTRPSYETMMDCDRQQPTGKAGHSNDDTRSFLTGRGHIPGSR